MSQSVAGLPPVMREVTWGEALSVLALRVPRGLLGAVERIHAAVGPMVGTRNTFAKLFRTGNPAELVERDRFRAWLLVASLGEAPHMWGLGDDDVPGIINREALRRAVAPEGPELLPRLDSNQQPFGCLAERWALAA